MIKILRKKYKKNIFISSTCALDLSFALLRLTTQIKRWSIYVTGSEFLPWNIKPAARATTSAHASDSIRALCALRSNPPRRHAPTDAKITFVAERTTTRN